MKLPTRTQMTGKGDTSTPPRGRHPAVCAAVAMALTLLVAQSNAGRWTYVNELSSKMELLFPVYHQIRVLGIGDSRALHGVNPVFFDFTAESNQTYPQGFNLAFSSAGVSCFAQMANNYGNHCPRLEWIVVDISPRMFNSKWNDGTLLNSLKSSEGCTYDVKNASAVWNHDNAALTTEPTPPNCCNGYSKWGYNTQIPDRAPNDGRAQFEAQAYLNWVAQTYGASTANYAYASDRMTQLTGFVDDMKSRGVKVIAFTVPNQSETYGKVCVDDNGTTSAGFTQIKNALVSLDNSKDNFWFMDLYTDAKSGFTNADFFNHDHVNTKGAQKVTNLLNAKIREILNANPANKLPSVSITQPSNNASFLRGDTIATTATASDPDGSIAKVEFFADGAKLGEDASSPYQYRWVNVPVGSHSLTARATDNQGGVMTSGVVTVKVTYEPPPGTNLARDRNVTASSSMTGFGPERAVDGDQSNNGRWNASSGAFPQWIIVDLGTVCTLKVLDIYFYEEGDGRAYNYAIDISNDNSAFTSLISRPGNATSGHVRETLSSAVTARYVKLTVTGAHVGGGWANVDEFEIYGTASTPAKEIAFLTQKTNDSVRVGDTVTIRWETNTSTITSVKIFLSENLGRTWQLLAPEAISKTGSGWPPYQWIVEGTVSGVSVFGKVCRLKITDYDETYSSVAPGYVFVLDNTETSNPAPATRSGIPESRVQSVVLSQRDVNILGLGGEPAPLFSPSGRLMTRDASAVSKPGSPVATAGVIIRMHTARSVDEK